MTSAYGSGRLFEEALESSGTLRIELDRSHYLPNMPVRFQIILDAETEFASDRVVLQITHLTRVVATLDQVVTGQTEWTFEWVPPPGFAGYGVTAWIERNGDRLAAGESAFDVASHWTEQPRYGFLSEFGTWNEGNEHEAFRLMRRLHLNGLQFYDWLYRHDTPVPPTSTFIDSMGRELNVSTIEAKIRLAREYGMAPMAYVAIYASSPPFHAAHPEWGLFDQHGKPIDFGDGYLYLMDPTRGKGWDSHLIAEFHKVLDRFDFAGVHIDQYGYPKIAFDAHGRTILLAPAFRTFLDDTKTALTRMVDERSVVTFNSVANWPAAVVAKSTYDFNYVEVWPPYSEYGDIETIIRNAYESSKGKATVIAAYVDAKEEATVRLLDAIIFAHGATHIELGEGNALLTDPYFPKFERVSPTLWQELVAYYDCIVRYKEWLYAPRVVLPANERVLLDGEAAGHRPTPGRVHSILYRLEGESQYVLSLINLKYTDTVDWRAPQPTPEPIEGVSVAVTVGHEPEQVLLVSPDKPSLAAVPLPFTTLANDEGYLVQFTAPLHYWSIVSIE